VTNLFILLQPNKRADISSSINIRLSILAIVVVGLVACSNRSAVHKSRQDSGEVTPITGHFSGLFPCADCSGLRQDLILRPDSTYILKRTYIAAPVGDTTFVDKGKWTVKKGNQFISGKNMCVLDPGDTLRRQLFEIVTYDSLLQLDREGKKINSPFNASLVRVNGQ